MKTNLLFILLFFSLTSFSTKRNVPSSYSSIQLALNACGTGDTVLVQPGTYAEHLVWPSIANIKLFSAGDSSNTIIDATLNGRCITINSPTIGVVDTNTVIKGFKLTNGFSDTTAFVGAAIYVNNADIKLLNVAICKNKVTIANSIPYTVFNGAVCYFGNYSKILNSSVYSNTISCNNLHLAGGLVYSKGITYNNMLFSKNEITLSSNCQGSGLILNFGQWFTTPNSYGGSLSNSKIIDNTINAISTTTNSGLNGGLLFFSAPTISSPTVSAFRTSNVLASNNTFNFGPNFGAQGLVCVVSISGACSFTSSIAFDHCVFANNFAPGSSNVYTSSLYFFGNGTGGNNPCKKTVYVNNCIFWNPAITGSIEMWFGNTGYGYSQIIANHSDINAFTGGINCINQNPQFISPSDFHLQPTSPCINTGDSAIKVPFDLDGNTRPINIFPDMGCYEYNPSLAVKENSTTNSHYIIYPNPTSNSLNIRSDKNEFENKEIEIINYLGQTVLKLPYADNISVSSLSSGYYIIKILTTSGQFNSNFIKE